MKISSSEKLYLQKQSFNGQLIPASAESNDLEFLIDSSNSYGDSLGLAKAIYKDVYKGKDAGHLNFDEPQKIYCNERGQNVCLFNSEEGKINLRWWKNDNVELTILSGRDGFFQAPLGENVWTKETTKFFKSLLEKIVSEENQTLPKKFGDDLFNLCVNILKKLGK